MIKYCLWLLCCLQMTTAWAHQPDLSSTVLMQQKDGTWLLQVKAALTAFEYEVEASQGANSYKTPEEFNAHVLTHLQKNISIRTNEGQPLTLQEGYVQLGHETNVLFKIGAMPDSLGSLQVTNTSFQDIHHNQSALIILKEGFQQQQFVLNNKNQHTAQLQVLQNNFQLVNPSLQTASMTPIALLGAFLLVLLSLLFFYHKKVILA